MRIQITKDRMSFSSLYLNEGVTLWPQNNSKHIPHLFPQGTRLKRCSATALAIVRRVYRGWNNSLVSRWRDERRTRWEACDAIVAQETLILLATSIRVVRVKEILDSEMIFPSSRNPLCFKNPRRINRFFPSGIGAEERGCYFIIIWWPRVNSNSASQFFE